jgi:hypothetical protein
VAGRYTGAWSRASAPPTAVPLTAAIDPEHLHPTDVDDPPGMLPEWASTAPAPTLPHELSDVDPAAPQAPGGPLDRTPRDHGYGMAGSHPMTVAEAQAARTAWQSVDMGAVAEHAYDPMTDRDGAPHVAVIPDTPGRGDSPDTLALHRTGVGQPNDPHARTGQRQKRWWDRVIDMHWWDVTYRPRPVRTARPQPPQPPVPGGNQLDSPYPTNVKMGTPDAFVAPQTRRSPVPWDQPITGDRTDPQPYALTSWGI